jgi:hypothetical protein
MENRGFIEIPRKTEPRTLFTGDILTPIFSVLLGDGENSRGLEISGALAEHAEKDDHRIKKESQTIWEDDPNAAIGREDLYVPVPGPYRRDVGLKLRVTWKGNLRFELKYNPASKPLEGGEPDRVNIVPSFRKESMKDIPTGGVDLHKALEWAAAKLKDAKLPHIADAVSTIRRNMGEPSSAGATTVAGWKLVNARTPLVAVAKARAQATAQPLYTGAVDTYTIEATYVRFRTFVPGAASTPDGQVFTSREPKFYFTLCFEHDGSAPDDVVCSRHAQLAAAWHKMDDRARHEGYPYMVARHAEMDTHPPAATEEQREHGAPVAGAGKEEPTTVPPKADDL